MIRVWAVIADTRVDWEESTSVILACYPDQDVAEQHRKLLHAAHISYMTSKRGMRKETFALLKALEPCRALGDIRSRHYRVEWLPFVLHVDQFMERFGK